jgi:hypothetical protein
VAGQVSRSRRGGRQDPAERCKKQEPAPSGTIKQGAAYEMLLCDLDYWDMRWVSARSGYPDAAISVSCGIPVLTLASCSNHLTVRRKLLATACRFEQISLHLEKDRTYGGIKVIRSPTVAQSL